jgi:hypothetical protein
VTLWRRAPLWLVPLVLMHAILLYDVLLHDPVVAYDSGSHLRYLWTISTLRLPVPEETDEFFSPPLPYLLAAIPYATGGASSKTTLKLAQVLNWGYSLAACVCLLAICGIARPGDPRLRFWSLFFLAVIPAYYRSFCFVRGEPLLMLLATAVGLQALRVFGAGGVGRGAWLLGLLLGLSALARQWAFALFPAVAAFALLGLRSRPEQRGATLRAIVVSLGVAAAVGGWFYVHLYRMAGTAMAFNRQSAPSLSLTNQPRSFYLDLALDRLFSDPVRPSLANLFLPTLYADLWGDYHAYFLVSGRDRRSGRPLKGRTLELRLGRFRRPDWLESNRSSIAPVLGRAMAWALVPTVVMLFGLAAGARSLLRGWSEDETSMRDAVVTLSVLVVVFAALLYFWFVLMYPRPDKGDTIKATYLLHVFPFAALLAGEAMASLAQRAPRLYRATAAALALFALQDLPLLFTRYPRWPS